MLRRIQFCGARWLNQHGSNSRWWPLKTITAAALKMPCCDLTRMQHSFDHFAVVIYFNQAKEPKRRGQKVSKKCELLQRVPIDRKHEKALPMLKALDRMPGFRWLYTRYRQYATGGTFLKTQECPADQIERYKRGANAMQMGGKHYKKLPIEPWDYIAANGLGFFEGNIIKYITRALMATQIPPPVATSNSSTPAAEVKA
jgi:hypothetical protein